MHSRILFAQYFGSSLQLTPHLHVLVPEGGWDPEANFIPLPPPSAEDVEAVLWRVRRQLAKDFADRVVDWPEDGLEALWAEGIQHRLPLEDEAAPRRPPVASPCWRGSASTPTPTCTPKPPQGPRAPVPLRQPRAARPGREPQGGEANDVETVPRAALGCALTLEVQ